MKVCAVQLNLKNCINQDQFLRYIESEVFLKNTNADLFVFPENINFSLLLLSSIFFPYDSNPFLYHPPPPPSHHHHHHHNLCSH